MQNLQIPNTGTLSGLSLVNDINLAITSLQNNRGGYLSKSVAGGSNVTLTTAEVDNALIAFNGALTANIQVIVPAASFQWVFYNGTTGAYSLTVKTSAGTGIAIPQGKVVILWCDGTNVLGLDYVSKAGDTLSGALNNAPQVTLASAATVNIGAASTNSVIISGTTTITAFDAIAAGALRIVKFSGALTLIYNATSLILPGGANITTAAGDVAIFESQGSGNWTCVSYTKANGNAIVSGGASLPGVLGQAFTSNGTFTIPTGVTAVKVTVVGGGGGGGGNVNSNSSNGGGGGGGTAISYLTGLTAGNTLAVTIGAGGGSAGNGGNSTVASGTQTITTITGGGGTGGQYNGGSKGGGGSASNGTINIAGQSGEDAFSVNIHNCYMNSDMWYSGCGGSSLYGLGGPAVSGQAGNGIAGTGYGGGGGGAGASGTTGSGGAGKAGIVIFEW